MAEFDPQGDSEKVKPYTFSAGSYDRLKSNEEIRKRYGMSTRPFRVPVMQYIRCCGREELFELVKLSEVPIDKQLFKVILELLKLNVPPAAILQVLKSLRSHNTPDDLDSHSPIPRPRHDSVDSKAHVHRTKSADISSPRCHSAMPTVSEPLLPPHSMPSSEGLAVRGAERGTQSEQEKRRSRSSDRQHKSRHKTKGKSSKSHDHTHGSAKLKINEPP